MKLSKRDQLCWVAKQVELLQQKEFYGKVTLDIQRGNVLRIEKVTESIKPPENIDGKPSCQGQPSCRSHQGSAEEDEQTRQAQEEDAQAQA